MPRGGARPGERRGGRKRGTRNKRSRELLDALEQAGCWPPAQIAHLCTDPQTPVTVQIDLLVRLLPYCYPQLKAVEPEGYAPVEQAAQLLGEQAAHFRDALQHYVNDPLTVALILDSLRAHSAVLDG